MLSSQYKILNKIKSTEELEKGIKQHMGGKKVVSTFFILEGGKHVGTYIVQCLNVLLYKKNSKKNGNTCYARVL